jgi:hypothetical protein
MQAPTHCLRAWCQQHVRKVLVVRPRALIKWPLCGKTSASADDLPDEPQDGSELGLHFDGSLKP